MLHQKINPDWSGEPCFVLATGPSLTAEVLRKVRMARIVSKWRALAINDACKVAPWADAMYACDNAWWNVHGNCFDGPKWACHQSMEGNNKLEMSEKLGLNLVNSRDGDVFSFDQSVIHHGSNSGFQAVNLAILFGCKFIVLVGFDMREGHFFGKHPDPLANADDRAYQSFANHFATASRCLRDVEIVNATPNSALTCFPMISIEDAIDRHDRLYWHRSESHTGTG